MAKRSAHRPRIRRGDTVVVLTGVDRGRRGRVLRVMAEESRVVVEGVNLAYRHIRRSQKHPQGGRLRRESPIHISNVMLVDPSDDEPTRVGRVVRDEAKGARGRVRISRRTGREIGELPAKKKAKKAAKEPRE